MGTETRLRSEVATRSPFLVAAIVPVLEKLGASTAGVRAPAVESTGEVVATEVVTHRKYYGKPGGKVNKCGPSNPGRKRPGREFQQRQARHGDRAFQPVAAHQSLRSLLFGRSR